jgi:hypothetical protein
MLVLQNKQEEVADLINYEVRYIENEFWSLEHYWAADIFFQSSFNLNNSLISGNVFFEEN